MIDAGFEDAGPDSLKGENFTWGAGALLNGPDKSRVDVATKLGNRYGFTDRLDYIFFKNGLALTRSQLVSERWPQGSSNWICKVNGLNETCLPSDHAGVFAILTLDSKESFTDLESPLPDNKFLPVPTPTILFFVILLSLLLLIVWLPYRLILKPLVFAPILRLTQNKKVNNTEKTDEEELGSQ